MKTKWEKVALIRSLYEIKSEILVNVAKKSPNKSVYWELQKNSVTTCTQNRNRNENNKVKQIKTGKLEIKNGCKCISSRNFVTLNKMLTVAGDTRVACVIFGAQSDSEVVGVVGVFCWLWTYDTSYFKSKSMKSLLSVCFICHSLSQTFLLIMSTELFASCGQFGCPNISSGWSILYLLQ